VGGVTWTYLQTTSFAGISSNGDVVVGSTDGNLNMFISQNQFNRLWVALSLMSYNIEANNNIFYNVFYCLTTPFPLGSASSFALGNVRNISYQHNVHHLVSRGVDYTATPAAAAAAYVNFNFSNNNFLSVTGSATIPGRGISVDISAGDADVTISSLNMNNNVFNTQATSDSSIYVNMDNSANIASIVCNSNNFDGTTVATDAITILDGAASGNQRIVCCCNQVFNGGGFNAGNIAAAANKVIYANNATA
jgi:hypothetical protein